jgi:transmembrane sensor
MNPNRLSYLFERYLNGTSTTAEEIELSNYILAPEHAEAIERLKEEFWEKTEGGPMGNAEAEKQLQRILQPTGRKAAIFSWKRIAAAASLVIGISTACYFIFSYKQTKNENFVKVENKDIEAPRQSKATITLADGKTISIDNLTSLTQNNVNLIKEANGKIVYSGNSHEVVYNTLTNPRGSNVIDMQLSDGSHVWLNAGSSVTYPVAFVENQRKVSVTGEAYFEVEHDGTKPFIVTKGETSVQVLGTHFNVNAYDDEPDIKVTLLEGSVQVSKRNANRLLKPGQQAKVATEITVVNDADLEQVMAWKNGKFDFGEGADLKEIMRQVARWYDAEVEYKATMNQQFWGSVSRLENVSKVLEKFELTGRVHFKIEGKKIIVTP